MDEGSLYELAESIRSQGVMQPILVRPVDGGYEIIAGERRFRAARLAGLDEVPVLVKAVADEAAAVMALIENIQREDLNPLEEAQGLQRLVSEFQLTHEQAAQAVGRSRSAASNLLRLLQPGRTRAADADGRRPGHGPCARPAGAGRGRAGDDGARGGGEEAQRARHREDTSRASRRRRIPQPPPRRPSRATSRASKSAWPTR